MRSKLGTLTWMTVALLAMFFGVDAAAHFSRYQYGETFSALVWQLERKLPILRVVIAALLLILFTHLEWQVP